MACHVHIRPATHDKNILRNARMRGWMKIKSDFDPLEQLVSQRTNETLDGQAELTAEAGAAQSVKGDV